MCADINCNDAFDNTPLDIAIAKKKLHCGEYFEEIRSPITNIPPLHVCHASDQRSCNTQESIPDHFPHSVAEAMMHHYSVNPTCKRDTSIFFSNIVNYSSIRGSKESEGPSHSLSYAGAALLQV